MPAIRTEDTCSEHEDSSHAPSEMREPSARSNARRPCPSSDSDSDDHDSHARKRQRQLRTKESIASSEDDDSSSDSSQTTPVHSSQSTFKEPITISGVRLRPTIAFDTFWRFAAERKSIDDRRRAGEPAPWTKDKILRKYFFCNTFRVLDKGCQFLIKEVIEKGSQQPEELVFRVILFNLFTKIETWKLLDKKLGPLKWTTYNHKKYAKVLSDAFERGIPLYTDAFIKPAPHFGHKRNYENHLVFLEVLMDNKLYARLLVAPYLADVYEYLYSFPSMGSFTAYQLILSLSYTNVLNFHRNDFVVSGPGSISGLRKLFGKSWQASNTDLVFHQEVMQYLVDSQDYHFKRLGLHFSGLGSKKLPMDIADVEHTLCEVDKYCRAAHPQLRGARQNIKRLFHSKLKSPSSNPACLPKAWNHPARCVPRVRPEKELRLEKRYEVNYIKAQRDRDGKRQYLVYWVGYPDNEASWEFESSLMDEAPAVVQDYLKKVKCTNKEHSTFGLRV